MLRYLNLPNIILPYPPFEKQDMAVLFIEEVFIGIFRINYATYCSFSPW